MEAAGDEIMGMVVEEAKDHLDEEADPEAVPGPAPADLSFHHEPRF